MVDIMASMDFADLQTITLDWEGDGHTPALVINTLKWFPQYNGQRLEHHWVVDMDDAFAKDNMDNDGLRVMADQLKEEYERQQDARGRVT